MTETYFYRKRAKKRERDTLLPLVSFKLYCLNRKFHFTARKGTNAMHETHPLWKRSNLKKKKKDLMRLCKMKQHVARAEIK